MTNKNKEQMELEIIELLVKAISYIETSCPDSQIHPDILEWSRGVEQNDKQGGTNK